MTEPTDALLPCPFCGEVPHLKRSIKGDYTSIVCPAACGGPLVIVIPNDRIEEGIAAWNRRTNSTMGQPAQAAESVWRDADRIEKWSDRIQRAHPKSEPEFWPDALRVKYMADEISDLRAARAPAESDLITIRKPTTSAEMLWLLKLAHLVISDVAKTLEESFAPAQPAAQQPAPSAAVVDAGFLRAVITLCNNRGASPESIEGFDSDDRWIADLWRQAEHLIATAPQADSQPAPVPDEAIAIDRTRDLASNGGRWPSDWVEAYRRGYSDRAARAPADSVQEDAALWRWLAEYLVGTRTDLDDEIVASETVNDLRKLVKAAIKGGQHGTE